MSVKPNDPCRYCGKDHLSTSDPAPWCDAARHEAKNHIKWAAEWEARHPDLNKPKEQ